MKQKCYELKNNRYICAEQNHRIMRMYSKGFNQMKELKDYVNENGIAKEDIVSIIQSKDGMFYLTWYAE